MSEFSDIVDALEDADHYSPAEKLHTTRILGLAESFPIEFEMEGIAATIKIQRGLYSRGAYLDIVFSTRSDMKRGIAYLEWHIGKNPPYPALELYQCRCK